MTSLEDKLLGEKKEYFCSSSEDESGAESGDEDGKAEAVAAGASASAEPPPIDVSDSGSTNTGPKGVIKDWQKFKQLEIERRVENERERLALIKKLALTCKSDLELEKEEDPELSDLFEDAFLLEYSKRRMQEMVEKAAALPKFGCVIGLKSGSDFLDAIDQENKAVTVVIHIYEDRVAGCKVMNNCLNELSKEYPEVKFCKILASVAGVSKHFKVSGVPALLVYKNGSLVGNYVKLTDEFGNEFSSADVESFLIENGMVFDKSCVPSIIRQSCPKNKDDEN